MALSFSKKKSIVEKTHQDLFRSMSVVFAEYNLNADQTHLFRLEARKMNVTVKVVPNRLMMRALRGTHVERAGLDNRLKGHLMTLISRDLSSGAKLVKLFKSQNMEIDPLYIVVDSSLFEGKDLDAVAGMPTRDEALSGLMGMLNAPTTQLARTMIEPVAALARLLSQISSRS